MVLERKRMLWAFEKSIFLVICQFLGDEVETIFGKVRQSVFVSNLGHKKLLGKWFLKQPEALKRILLGFYQSIFHFFPRFWVMKLKPYFRKVRQSFQNFLNQNLGIRNFLENGFGATLSSKRMFWAFEKSIFQFFARFPITVMKPFLEKVR